MPLNTTIERDGELLKMPNGWGGFHVVAMTIAAALDEPECKLAKSFAEHMPEGWADGTIEIGPGDVFHLMGYHVLAATPLNDCRWELRSDYRFRDLEDDEILELKRGDLLNASRSF